MSKYSCSVCGVENEIDECYYFDGDFVLCDTDCATEHIIENAEDYVKLIFGG